MSKSNDLTEDDLLNTQIVVPHDFELDVNSVVALNHRLTLDAISKVEADELATILDDFADDPQSLGSTINWRENFYADLRKAANHLALVGLVTRLEHWINRWVANCQIPKNGSPLS